MIEFLPPALIPMSHIPPVSIEQADRARWLYWSVMGPNAVCWLTAYGLAIHRGQIDKRVAIPALLVPVNFAWEFCLSLILDQDVTQRHTNFYWMFLDLFIFWQALRYGPKDYPTLTPKKFGLLMSGMLLWSSLMVTVGTNEFGDIPGVYTGTFINVPLSVAFIYMLRNRGSSAGQSMYIAVAKALGSFMAGITVFIMFPGHWLFFVLFPTVWITDVVYITLLHRQIRAEGQSPWDFKRPPVPDRVMPATAVVGLGSELSGDATMDAEDATEPANREDAAAVASTEAEPDTEAAPSDDAKQPQSV